MRPKAWPPFVSAVRPGLVENKSARETGSMLGNDPGRAPTDVFPCSAKTVQTKSNDYAVGLDSRKLIPGAVPQARAYAPGSARPEAC
jgi:hypothetical protein